MPQSGRIYGPIRMPRRSTPNPLAKGIGSRIAQLRLEQGLTAEKLAYESDVGSKGFLSDIEHGLALPSLTTLERIAQRLDVSLYDLLVFPEAGDRERLIEQTRAMSKGTLVRILRELVQERSERLPRVPPRLHEIRAYAALEVAAGWSTPALPRGEPEEEIIRLPGRFQRNRDFAVRASGHSMQGFRSTIRDGDWLVMRKAHPSLEAAIGQIVLIAREDKYGDRSLHVKRVAQKGRRLWLRSDDTSVKPIAAVETDEILATLVAVVAPAHLAPAPNTRFPGAHLATVFGLSRAPAGAWSRVDGHLFFLIQAGDVGTKGAIPVKGCTARPAETAFVLGVESNALQYLGLARFDAPSATWRLCDPTGR